MGAPITAPRGWSKIPSAGQDNQVTTPSGSSSTMPSATLFITAPSHDSPSSAGEAAASPARRASAAAATVGTAASRAASAAPGRAAAGAAHATTCTTSAVTGAR
jgi:hypothetical protein